MSKAVLIVDANDARRAAIRQALAARGLMTLEVSDPFSGLAALGRADFGAVIVSEGKRHLSLRGLIQLAKKRHPDIRIFIILSSVANADAIQAILGVDVNMVPPEWGVEQLATGVSDAVDDQGGPPANPWSGESASAAPERVTLPRTEPGVPDDESIPEAEADLSLEGSLEDGSGAGLLMGLFAQELTGRLTMRSGDGAQGAIVYFYRGEPVWADDADGDAGLFRRLIAEGMLPPTTSLTPMPQGTLLSHLVQSETLTAERAHDVMRKTVREHVLHLANRIDGTYEFLEDRSFLDHAPLLKLNPFGLIFESRRNAYTPDKLLALGSEIAGCYLHPGPGIAVAADKLKPFVRDLDLSEHIDGKHTVEEFASKTGLDLLMGTLMVLTMDDAKLIVLAEHEMVTDNSVVNVTRDSVLRSEWDEMSLPEVSAMRSESGGGEARSDGVLPREEILQLYVRMKPLTQPAQVLGVPLHADTDQLDVAYRARMQELDDRRVPDCNDADVLRGHLGELRRKVKSAYDTLKLEAPAGGGPTLDSNPF